ncbi:hypothetical protein HOO54_01225 [Bacillus sp. WMMC1349]|uniref:hypothetical protein n=1 Tax=Bacillus sp. WMMC1349 TaxID=2736254 RepID=UPI001554F2CC|nr:hypothetical protein [Bacillus sp. WMMC1349]NPC90843.1 hypothetical protein [Bacillus sp. WMMC1349]NPC90899.1 hypothetical protein [Bacillus sp. WMMC1349]NPC90902.1 hypothetical protein [Bacillus sp. WMMC1349]NPC90926.1 hypothetical protein [Bacillus sp. WMMC1349]
MKEIKPKDLIQFRLPVDTPEVVIKKINKLKKQHGRKFGSEIADRLINIIETEALTNKKRNSIVVPLPNDLTYREKKKLESEEVRHLIGQIAIQLLREPAKAVRLSSQEDEAKKIGDNEETETAPFIQNKKVLQFAQDNFLDFDDEDD